MWRYGWMVVFLAAGLMACTASPPETNTPTSAAVAAATIAVTSTATF